ncbi:unnamed protein product [Miscanthus lutarioriparius]|uniref:Rx N-terminal domain-containing protein n=1 Tax=Miscanthus lutarioriparius TaxID=422564 RepID=A0A811QBI7_9POAL|nr:unnamed protein product [Miscanthus lutarioriparius]
MEALISAVAGELVSRFISFVAQNFCDRTLNEDDHTRLEHVLLRTHTIVEEAEGRCITNRGMLLQLKMLMEGMYEGHYVLDRFKIQSAEEGEVSHQNRKFDISILTAAKRLRFTSATTKGTPVTFGTGSTASLKGVLDSLEAKIQDMREFVMLLGSCPRLPRGAFGSMDPHEHPKLASLGMQLAAELKGSFLGANILGEMLRSNPNSQFWRAILSSVRALVQEHMFSLGVHPEDLLERNVPVGFSNVSFVGAQSQGCLVYDLREAGPGQEELPLPTSREVLTGVKVPAEDKFDVLVWKSRIPPYCSYIVTYERQKAPQRIVGKKNRLALTEISS